MNRQEPPPWDVADYLWFISIDLSNYLLANSEELVLGYIEADVCKQIFVGERNLFEKR